jgi:integrase
MNPANESAPKREPRRRKLSEFLIRRIKPEEKAFNVWDSHTRGLVLRVQPSGQMSWKAVYRFHGKPTWYSIGAVGKIGLSDARKLAARVMLQVAEGKNPHADRRAERGAGTFAEVAAAYVERHAKKKNKSWAQADHLVKRYLIPRWGKLQARGITRADVRATTARIEAPVLANQILAAASAIFSWAMKQDLVEHNPCRGVDRNETKSRERILSDSEIPIFWRAFDDAGLLPASALKLILLTGQRPGEICHMRREHIVDGWWELPAEPQTDKQKRLIWPGTKNKQSHRVWLSTAARSVIAELADEDETGFVLAGERGAPVGRLDDAMRAMCSKLSVEPPPKTPGAGDGARG